MSVPRIHNYLSTDTPRYERLRRLAKRFPELDVSAITTCLSMLRLAQELTEGYDAHFSRHGLSQGRFVILIHLLDAEDAHKDGWTPAELAEHAGVSRATMTGLMDTLEKDGLISRENHPSDRRMYTVRLTPKAHAFLQGMLPDHYRRISALMSPLSETERTTLQELLAKVASGIPALKNP
ncbi:MarR family winged helix-turn-helix transcriptional regulator [Stigmatella aurantiaca]|uniref:MarR family transcriptional regulatory protein n=1 Tax=Stigmatella aurantiaca (strain DW4/3-1) TaxID=378806 RepID=Q08VS1_STIAD|nr:MarR family transcriptional regulator [Stigmatella aurantiaca]ADO74482.1 transcriptional regulatory, MarR family protein [Stigmatella aurantiaca DW4/3-1]EAU64569.1 MarR family transcriptional regulatory protein [Stigmatella aurantiaca DW4/3-1]